MIGIILSAGIMALVSAYLLFKVREANSENDLGNSLQIMFFFMVLASFIIMGSAGYEARNDCDYVLSNSTVVANTTFNEYEFLCTERITGGASWVYRLPIFLAGASALYLVVWLLMLIFRIIKHFMGGSDRG